MRDSELYLSAFVREQSR